MHILPFIVISLIIFRIKLRKIKEQTDGLSLIMINGGLSLIDFDEY